MSRMAKARKRKRHMKRETKKLILVSGVIYLITLVLAYTYFCNMEDLRQRNIDLYEDYSTPEFNEVIEEIFK